MKLRKQGPAAWRDAALRLPWLLLIPFGLLIPRLCQNHAASIEWLFSDRLYGGIKGALSAVTSLVSFSVAELLLYGVVLAVTAALLAVTIRVILGRAPLAALAKRLVNLGIWFGALLVLFYATWGLNYFREPLKERLSLNVTERPVEELEELTKEFAECANALRRSLWEDGDGVARMKDGYTAMFRALPGAYEALAREYGAFDGKVTRPKTVLWSKGLSWCGITGVYIGLTAEPNVNVDAPDFLLPQTAAHELAHQLGVASEDEAEFAGILACLYSDDPLVAYSGLLSALISCGNALHKQAPERYRAIYDTYGPGLLHDLRYHRAYWKAFEGKTEEKANQMNDAYLRYNGQENGVMSYGKVVDMLLAYREQIDFLGG